VPGRAVLVRRTAIAVFTSYLLSALVLQRYTGNGFGIVRIIFLALLFANIRGNWLATRWALDQPSSSTLHPSGRSYPR
jgi:predicted acyltransferase